MKLVIVIPYYKIEFFSQTLDSLKKQTNKEFKIFIGNDGSSCDPKDLITEFSKYLDIDYFDFKNNIGGNSLIDHWNRCIQKAKQSDWIMILGDDDVLGKNCVEDFYTHLPCIQKKEANVVRFATKIINSNNNTISRIHTHKKLENSVDFILQKIKGPKRSSLSEHLFKREQLNFKNFPLAWYSDDLAILETSNFGSIYSINTSVVSIRKSSLNISSQKNLFRLKNIATFEFYHHLINNYSVHFQKEQTAILYDKYQKGVLNDKWNFSLFLMLSKTYLKKKKFISYFRFLQLYNLNILNAYRSKSRKI